MVRDRNGSRRWRGAVLGAFAAALAAQGLPPLPSTPGGPFPEREELLPLRPFESEGGLSTSRVPFGWRGERVSEQGNLWTLEQGAIQGQGVLLLADRIEYRLDTGELKAEGRIRLEGPDLRLRCERLLMDWRKQVGEAESLVLELPPSWVLQSDRVSFTSLRHWSFESVVISPCPEEKPGWQAKASKLNVDLDGFAKMWWPRIWVGHVPAFVMPFAVYPAKAQRSSGLLPPSFGGSSTLGASLGLSYFQTLGPTADLTFAPEFFSKEGVLWGAEARWQPDLTHQGKAFGQVIRQRSLVDQNDAREAAKRAAATQPGYNPDSPDYQYVSPYRYRYNLKEVWQREDGWQLTADVNQASDNLVDVDFGKGISNLGLPSYDSAFYAGRSMSWGSVALTAGEQRTFFLTRDQGDPFYSPDFPASLRRQTRPQAEVRFYPLALERFYLDGGFQASEFAYQLQGGQNAPDLSYQWGRQDAHARLHGRLGQVGPLRMDLELMGRATRYTATLGNPVFDPDKGESGQVLDPLAAALDPFKVDGPAANRVLASAHLRFTGFQLGRTYPGFHLFGYKGEMKHIVEPYFGFTETSRYSGTAEVPRFDAVDARPGVNDSASGEESVEFGVKQHFLGRPGKGSEFADLVRWKISTRYHFRPIILSDGRFQKGWASLDSDMDVEPNDKLRVSFRRSSDLVEGGSDDSLSAEYKDKRGGRVALAFFSTGINRFLVRQKGLQLGGIQRFMDDRLRLEFQANYDYRAHAFATSQVALTWVEPCVAYILRYSHVNLGTVLAGRREDRLDITLSLRGLGDLFSYRW